jgi:DNA-binding HxlR family transcriptional regulator
MLTDGWELLIVNDEEFLKIMPRLDFRRVDALVEDVLGCRWSISVLRAVKDGVRRPGELERHIEGISTKVLGDRLKAFTRAGVFEREIFPEVPPRVEYRLSRFGGKFVRLIQYVEELQAELDAEAG